ncbi:SDR family NAD(P)-dependent oxidoreductase, partial [Luteibacter sp. CQ10]|uniref:SDR family NAD(P)-dependent oxidoreductase n=1 Tax=Luteibacter sp. CQ10 TaxID=2805821 RepID=UPI0034A457DA
MDSLRDEFRLSARHPVLRDHVVHGRHVLPGLAYVDLVYQLLREHGFDHRQWTLRRLSIYHPLSVSAGEEIHVEIDGRRIDDATWQVDIHGTPPGEPRRRYGSVRVVRGEPVRFDETIDLHAVAAACVERIPLERIHAQCVAHGLVHRAFMKPSGVRYRTAEAIYVDCAVDAASRAEGMALLFHPALLDSCAIGTGGLATAAEHDGPLPLLLPISFDAFRASRPLDGRCVARIRHDALRMRGDVGSVTLDFFDETGAKVAELIDLSTKAVAAPAASIGGTDDLDPVHVLEDFVREIVARHLGVGPDDVDADCGFYDMGLDSASLLELSQVVEDRLSVPMPPTLLFEHTTPRALARHLRERGGEPPTTTAATATGACATDDVSVEGVAIVGMAGRFPEASDVRELWRNLLAGRDCVSEVPPSRWDWHLLDPVISASGKAMSRWGGFIADADSFDAEFFHVVPRDAETMDPQERKFVEVAWEAIEDAGHTPATLAAARPGGPARTVGVFAGAMHKDYALLGVERLRDRQLLPLSLSSGMIANRVSYVCDFHGPSITVDTLCSSSLTAVHLAVESLRRGECDAALAGGVNLSLHPAKYLGYGMADMHSSDGRCRSFGEGGDGYVPAEAVGAVLLKPLRDALAEGDAIYAVIRGSAVNHGGAVSGFSVPSPVAQAAMIEACLARAGVDARSIGYVEAHGTGTSLGDPIEIEGLTRAFRRMTDDVGFCAIGSLKSNIGHAEGAAGIAGLIKAALQLKHRTRVASLHANTPHPRIDWANSPFVVQTRTEAWSAPTLVDDAGTPVPRRAALSSFGATGSNAHVVLEEYVDNDSAMRRASGEPALVVLSARDATRLRALAWRLHTFLEQVDIPLDDLAYTLQVGRVALDHRLAFIVRDTAELTRRLRDFARDGVAQANGSSFTGERTRDREAWNANSRDERASTRATTWMREGDLVSIAHAWTGGASIDWIRANEDSAARRVNLPGYPFAKVRHWFPDASSAPTDDVASARPLLLTPDWVPFTAGPTTAPVEGERWVLLAGWPAGTTAAALAAQLPAARVDVLAADDGASLDARVARAGWQLLERVQAWLRTTPGTGLHVQVVVPAAAPVFQALSGLLKTARLEQPRLRGQVLGVASLDDASQVAACLALAARGEAAELRFDGEVAQARSYRPLAGPATGDGPWKRDGVYLITGGGGGVGQLFAREIGARAPGATVVLSGRSAASAAVEATLSSLRAAGLRVAYERADVTDAASVTALVATILARHGRLDGVVHAAGVLADGFLLKKREADYAAVLAPKVRGTVLLDRATRELPLDCFVLFSSATGAHGNVGQGDYALANAFMDAYAQERSAAVARGEAHGHTLSVGWPLWEEGGMRVDALRREELRASGIEAMPTAAAMTAFAQAYASGQAQVQVLYGATRPAQSPSVPPSTSTSTSVAAPAATLGPRVLARVQALFAAVTKLSASRIDVDEPLESYGIDSIMVMQLNARLATVFEEVSKTLFYEYPTLAGVAAHLVASDPAACARWTGDATPVAPGADHEPRPAPTPSPAPRPAPAERAIAIVGLSGRYAGAADL